MKNPKTHIVTWSINNLRNKGEWLSYCGMINPLKGISIKHITNPNPEDYCKLCFKKVNY
jgi:hypothetical protein